jgi:hypothetical protein
MPDDCKYTEEQKHHITGSFVMVMKMIAELRLDLEVARLFLKELGVSREDFEEIRAHLKQKWDAQGDAKIAEIKDRMQSERLRKLLDSAEGKPQ